MRSDGIPLFEKIAFDFEHQPCDGFGLSFHVVERIVVELHHVEEIVDMRFAVEDVGAVGQSAVEGFVLVAFVGYFTHYLLEDVFQREQAERGAVLVHDDGHVYLVALELFEQVVYLFVFRYVVGFP